MQEFARCFKQIVWGWPVLGAILLAGANLSFRTGFFQITHCGVWLKYTWGSLFKGTENHQNSKDGISPFQALNTALAGSIGTGNIVGVATALTIGGPGAVFWMWVSAVLGMMTIFGETILAVKYREKNKDGQWTGGAMYYLEKGVHSPFLAGMFACACVLASLGMGNMAQANSISGALNDGFSVPVWITGLIVAFLLLASSIGGLKGTAKITEKLVPIMSAAYLVACFWVLICFKNQIIPAFSLIFHEAFSLRATAGGTGASVMLISMKCGISRGIFTNEAGLGSAVMAYAGSTEENPVKQGFWAIFQVFVDTIVICTLTALCILCTGVINTGKDGAALSTAAFSAVFGEFGKGFVCASIAVFAFATMLAWCCYGQRAIEYLTGGSATEIYRLLFCSAAYIGCCMQLSTVWDLCDSFNGLMAIPNLAAIFMLSGEIVEEIKKETLKQNDYKIKKYRRT